jgi:superfamily I DNA/RNA helicase
MDDLLLYGPPGTGKTHRGLEWLAARVEQDGADPRRVAFVSFTNAAVNEAKGRLCERFDLAPQELPYCRTLHSLCKQVLGITGQWQADSQLTQFAETYGYDLQPSRGRAGDDDLETLHTRSGRDAPLLAIWDFTRHRLIEDPISGWQEFADYAPESIAFAPANRFLAFVADYEKWKSENCLRDFTDLMTEFLECPDALNVSVAVVDEAQDLSPLMWAVADQLFARATYRATLGDDDQCIYSYSGAVPALMNQRSSRARVKLKQSYRLPRAVTQAALSIINQNEDREPKEIIPTNREGVADRATYLEELPLLNGESWFVLGRNWKVLTHLAPTLEEHGIPYIYGGGRYSPWQDRGPVRAVKAILQLTDPASHGITAEALWNLADRTSVERKDRPGLWQYGAKKKLQDLAQSDPEARITWRELLTLGMTVHGFQQVMRQDLSVLTREISQRDLRTYEQAIHNGTFFKPVTVTLSSIHARKGQEAENVACVMACTGGPARAMLRPERLEEERRVGYVGATRARQRLYGLLAPPTSGLHSWDLLGV